ncbi:MAG TPA: TIGR02996 domain-containing protein, partial [Gemmataceae bacterium]|nr:TIGR02996 domain-containing protein [Gemmataceae bacterium]
MFPTFTDEDKAFLRGILTNPADLTGWLAYADWLDEHDSPDRAEFIRLEVRRTDPDVSQIDRFGIQGQLEDVRAKLDPDWVAIFDRPRIENCDQRFAFQCPKQWENLAPTDLSTVRRCDGCRKLVHYCHDIDEARAHARQGHCVAVSLAVPRSPRDLSGEEEVVMGLLLT